MARTKGSLNKKTSVGKIAAKSIPAKEIERTETFKVYFDIEKIKDMIRYNAIKKAGFDPNNTTFESVELTATRLGTTIILLNPTLNKKEEKIKVEKISMVETKEE